MTVTGPATFASTAIASSATTAASTACGRSGPSIAGHLDAQLPAVQHTSVHGIESILSIAFVVEPNKRKATAFARMTITRNVNVSHLTAAFKDAPEIVRGRAVRKVVDLEGNHSVDPWRRPPVATAHAGICYGRRCR